MYWQLREARLELQRLQSLQSLDELRLRDRLRQRSSHEEVLRDMELFLTELHGSLADKQALLHSERRQVEESQQRKEALESELNATHSELEALKSQQQQRTLMRALISNETERQKQTHLLQQEAGREMARKHEEEMTHLLSEVQAARDVSVFAENLLRARDRESEQTVFAMSAEENELQVYLQDKNHEIEVLKSEQNSLKADLQSLQQKLSGVTQLAKQLMDENESILRHKSCQVRILRANTGLVRARVAALSDLADEQNRVKKGTQMAFLLQDESREIAELESMKEQCQEGLQTLWKKQG